MDDQTIQTGADNIKDGQPLPDPEQIDTGSGFDEEGHRKDIELRSLVENINNIAFSSVNSENVRHGIKQALSIYSNIEEAVTTLKKWLDSMPDAWADIIEQSVELDAYLVEELKKPEYGGRTFDDLIADLEKEGWEPSGDFPEGTLARKAWDAAKEARRAAEEIGKLSFKGDFMPMLNHNPFNELVRLSKRDFVPGSANKAYYDGDNAEFILTNFNKMSGRLSVSEKKILHAAIMALTDNNYYKTDHVNPVALISLKEYGTACGWDMEPKKKDTPEEQEVENERIRNNKKTLKKAIRKNLSDISNIVWSATIKGGNAAGDYREYRIISSHTINKDTIKINFDIDAATFLVKSYIMQFPLALLKISNMNPNAYSIGYKIALHNCNDNNFSSGTNNTLSVKTLLNSAEQIVTKSSLDESGQRNWREKIKGKLETALNTLVEVGLLKKWEYRNTKTGTIYTAEQANKLSWENYILLMVDWSMELEPDQAERRAKRAAEIAAREKKPPAKKKSREPAGRKKADQAAAKTVRKTKKGVK